MIIKKEESKKRKKFFSFNKFLYFYFFSSLLVFLFLSIFILQSYTFQKIKNKYLDLFSKAGRYEYLYLPQITYKALKSNFYKLNKIDLEINFEDILIIENARKNAIAKGFLPPADQLPKVKANIILNEKKFRGDLRLKGDRKAHFEEKDKSSYKIEMDRNQYIYGMKKFSLQKPRLRNYVHEWIFHEMSGDLNIIKIKYDFINLLINGEDKGLYVIEEGFGKELIERNERRNGPIFSLNEDIYGGSDNPVFEIYNKNYWNQKQNNSLSRIASQKLRDFFNDKVELEEIFDLEKWASYFAVIDMTSNYHGAFLKSVKLYYNPLNGLFEPIPFDGHRLKPNYHKYNLSYDNRILIDIIMHPANETEVITLSWLKKFFFVDQKINQNFYNLYLKKLELVSSEKFINKFLTKKLDKIEEINSHIYADYFFFDNSRNYGVGLYYFLLDDFKFHAKNIKTKIKNKTNIQVLKINETKFLVKNFYKNYGGLLAKKLVCKKDENTIEIQVNKLLNNFSDTLIEIHGDEIKNAECTHALFVNKFNNNSMMLKIDYINSKYIYDSFKNFDSKLLDMYFVKIDQSLFLKKDEVIIDRDLYIPKGFQVIIKPGQKLLLINNAFIISNSPWKIGGENKQTIITGEKNNLGGGIYIGETNKLSEIKNTKISYLNGYSMNTKSEYLILGSINFHQTNLEIEDVYFKNIFSEDAINIFRSDFSIKSVNYKDIFSDAIDIDFSKGEINNARFININNDAIDFSGSTANVHDAYFNNVNDKLISVGEKSKINIRKIKAINSYAGIISKDGSEVNSKEIDFDGVKIPFAAYQKKKEYAHGNLIAKNYKINNFYTKWIKDKESSITINDLPIETETKKILQIIYEKKLFLLKNN